MGSGKKYKPHNRLIKKTGGKKQDANAVYVQSRPEECTQ